MKFFFGELTIRVLCPYFHWVGWGGIHFIPIDLKNLFLWILLTAFIIRCKKISQLFVRIFFNKRVYILTQSHISVLLFFFFFSVCFLLLLLCPEKPLGWKIIYFSPVFSSSSLMETILHCTLAYICDSFCCVMCRMVFDCPWFVEYSFLFGIDLYLFSYHYHSDWILITL